MTKQTQPPWPDARAELSAAEREVTFWENTAQQRNLEFVQAQEELSRARQRLRAALNEVMKDRASAAAAD